MRTVVCSECGASFQPAGSRDATCSLPCAKLRAKKQRVGHTPGRRDEQGRWIVKCAECGNEHSAVAGRKTCSADCETKRKRARWRAYWHSLTATEKEAHKARQRARHAADPEQARAAWRRQSRRQRERSPIPPATCDVCGKQFQGKRKDSRFCSPECQAAVAPLPGGERRQVESTCAVCQRKFTGRRNQIYCGPSCSREAMMRRQRKARREVAIADDIALAGLAIALERSTGKYLLTCRECGAPFRSDSALKQVCSKTCHDAKWARRKREASPQKTGLPPLPCEICGTEFTPDRRHAKTCSEWCRAEAKRIAMRERAKRPAMREHLKLLARKRLKVTAACIVCGRDMSEMPDLKKNRYTCSHECRREALRRKQRRTYERRIGKAGTDRGLERGADGGPQGAAHVALGENG